MENPDLPKKVLSNTTRFRSKMTDAGFTLTVSKTLSHLYTHFDAIAADDF